MDKGNVNKHRYTYSSGIKAVETSKWGEAEARKRYGSPEHGAPQPKGSPFPKDPEGRPGAKNYNDHPNDWVRGKGESAEGMPGYGRSRPREK
jgi:hypothetical protein